MNVISLVIGFAALGLALVGFIPLLGWLNWLVIPLAVAGTAFGILARGTSGRNLNILVLVVAAFRLMIGGGLL
jgi:hypothetical protein